jgi:Kef-type K+ transport system membrane component KefB
LLSIVAVVGKFMAGYAPFWIKGQKSLIGAGMVPRGEVGLIFAQLGLSSGVFDAGMFAVVTLVVMATTFLAPPLLKHLSRPVRTIRLREEARVVDLEIEEDIPAPG